jgi:hypothetical protein
MDRAYRRIMSIYDNLRDIKGERREGGNTHGLCCG